MLTGRQRFLQCCTVTHRSFRHTKAMIIALILKEKKCVKIEMIIKQCKLSCIYKDWLFKNFVYR